MLELLLSLFTDYTVRTVALGAATLGIVSGAFGTFAVLRRQSLLGDAMSHAALPGVVIAYLIIGDKNPTALLIGAAISGILAAWFFIQITTRTRIKEDSALGILLSVFFGFGLMMFSLVEGAGQAGLKTFLFGQAATLLERDVITMALFGGAALILMLVFWKEFKLLSFDSDFGESVGLPMRAMNLLLTALLVVAITIGLQAVGVVLMSAMVVAPAAAARQWTDRLGVMTALSSLFGAIAGVVGSLISSSGSGLSTGPVIVLVISSIVIISLIFAPNRGLLWRWLNTQRNKRTLQLGIVLSDMHKLAIDHINPQHPHPIATLRLMNAEGDSVANSLRGLVERGLVEEVSAETYALTKRGINEASYFAVNGKFREKDL